MQHVVLCNGGSMIELSEELRNAVQAAREPVQLIDPVSRETFVLVPAAVYERLRAYDAGPWTDDEMDVLAAEAGEMLDRLGKKP